MGKFFVNKDKNKYRAFSLIELSIVLVILGILTIGATQGSFLIQKAKIFSAKRLTETSGVDDENLVFWFETSLEKSFLNKEAVDGGEISQWNSIATLSGKTINAYKTQITNPNSFTYEPTPVSTIKGPTYIQKGINFLPSLNFASIPSSSVNAMVVDPNFYGSGGIQDLSLFVVFRYKSGSGYVIDRQCVYAGNIGIGVGCSSPSAMGNGSVLFDFYISGTNNGLYLNLRGNGFSEPPGGTWLTTGLSAINNAPHIFLMQRKYGVGFYAYLDGALAPGSRIDNLGWLGLDLYKIGHHSDFANDGLNADISEIIFFAGELSDDKRRSITSYLSKKYRISLR